MIGMLQGASDPAAMMQQIMQQNPQSANVLTELQKSGGTAKDAFYAIARRKGYDPDEIVSQLK